MSDRHVNIIALDVPYPADYGGVMDIFYKIKWLHSSGIQVHLHCFSSGRPPRDELDQYCATVHYYKRKSIWETLPLALPYMLASRHSDALLKNLQQNNYPVLIEGIQCSYVLYKKLLPNRKVFLRLHNTEYLYYQKLAHYENNFFKKLYYKNEARLLKKYEQQLAGLAPILAISQSDIAVYKKRFGTTQIQFLPAFTAWQQMNTPVGKGGYCLYHGNLGINENQKAVEWLLEHVFSKTDIPFVVAGKRPTDELIKKIAFHPNCRLIKNPENIEMQKLVIAAQVNVLPSFNNTGVKLKLLNALYNGRHCLVNKASIEGAQLDGTCVCADDANSFLLETKKLFAAEFDDHQKQQREQTLQATYNNEKNARSLIQLLFEK